MQLGEEELFHPLFMTEFELDPVRLRFTPDEDEYQEGVAELIADFQQTAMQNQNLVSDNYFNAFTRLTQFFIS